MGWTRRQTGRSWFTPNESLALGGFSGSSVCPGEGLTFYDIEGALETAPVAVGSFLADIRGPSVGDSLACLRHRLHRRSSGSKQQRKGDLCLPNHFEEGFDTTLRIVAGVVACPSSH